MGENYYTKHQEEKKEYEKKIQDLTAKIKKAEESLKTTSGKSGEFESLISVYRRALMHYAFMRGEEGHVVSVQKDGNLLVVLNPMVELGKATRGMVVDKKGARHREDRDNPEGGHDKSPCAEKAVRHTDQPLRHDNRAEGVTADMKKFLPIAIMFLMLLPLYADWSDHNLTLLSTGSSSVEGASKFELKDGDGRIFFINSVGEPERPVMKRILKHKDEFFSWKNITIKELSFYMYEKGVQATIVPSSVAYKDTDLKPYLPSGFTFIEEKDGLDYRYRIIVGNTSLKLDGSYKGEEPLLDEMNAYIKGIREGKIVVEDEKVVSGSVVSFTGEKDKGGKQVHPIGDLTDLDGKPAPSAPAADASGNR